MRKAGCFSSSLRVGLKISSDPSMVSAAGTAIEQLCFLLPGEGKVAALLVVSKKQIFFF